MCLRTYRDPATNYRTTVSNKIFYNKANIPRIDSFILKITRNHISNAIKNESNPLISAPFKADNDYIRKIIAMGRLPVKVFPLLDREGYIQDDRNLPIIYHVSRHAWNGVVKYNKVDLDNMSIRMVSSTALPTRDIVDKSRYNNKKYTWLQGDC